MDILLIVLALTILLSLVPARSSGERSPARPAPICRYVDINELRKPGLSARLQLPPITETLRRMPTLEQDLVESVSCGSSRMIASTRNGLLFIRTEDSRDR